MRRLVIAVLLLAAAAMAQPQPTEFFVCGRRVWTMAGPPVSPGCVHVRRGKIVAVVARAPGGSTIYNYSDADLTPGLVDIHSHITLRGDPRRSGEQNERTDDFLPELNILDALDPWDPSIRHAVSGGVTTVIITPGSIPIVSGQNALLKLKAPPLENMVLRAPAGVKATSWKTETYEKMDRWLTEGQQAIAAGTPVTTSRIQVAIALLRREIPLIVHGGYPSGEIEPMLAIVDKFHLRLIVYHCETCDENFEEIVARDIPVVVGPRMLYWHSGRDTNVALALLRRGVKIAITCDAGSGEQKYLRDQAGLAVHYGMSVDDALRAITLTPAEIIGIADRIGSLEAGKDADLVVFSGPVFSASSRVLRVFIDGSTEYEGKR
jgi:imidazolonepropionase-like amidohydrolase